MQMIALATAPIPARHAATFHPLMTPSNGRVRIAARATEADEGAEASDLGIRGSEAWVTGEPPVKAIDHPL